MFPTRNGADEKAQNGDDSHDGFHDWLIKRGELQLALVRLLLRRPCVLLYVLVVTITPVTEITPSGGRSDAPTIQDIHFFFSFGCC